jgi:hypothetical protein
MQMLAQSIDRFGYVLAGAIRDKAKQEEETKGRLILVAAGVLGLSSSLSTIILYLILR